MTTIREEIVTALEDLTPRTRAQVVEHYAAAEAAKQAGALIKGLDKLREYERELLKVKPTFAGYDIDGKPVGEAIYTKEQIEQRNKLHDQIEKLNKAINKADDKNDFGDLYNLTK